MPSSRPACAQPEPGALLRPLLGELLDEGRAVRLRVTGGSMRPTVNTGDHVRLEPCRARDARIGDLVLFERREGGLGLHRLVRRRLGTLQTGGDAMRRLDLPVSPPAVMARVTAVERAGRVVSVRGRAARLRGRLAALRLLARGALAARRGT